MRRGPVHESTHGLRAILFDKDGTLLDYARTWVPINCDAAVMAASGDLQLADELLALGGQDARTGVVQPGSVLAAGTHEEIAAVFAARLGPAAPARLADRIGEIFRDGGARHSVLIDGTAEALQALRRAGLRLGIATNDTADGLSASMGRHPGLLELFEFTVGCDSGHGGKPEPGMVQAFCAALALDANEIAVVGDAVHDLEMGRRAGVGLKVGVLGGTSTRDDLAPHADLLLPDVTHLPRHLGIL